MAEDSDDTDQHTTPSGDLHRPHRPTETVTGAAGLLAALVTASRACQRWIKAAVQRLGQRLAGDR